MMMAGLALAALFSGALAAGPTPAHPIIEPVKGECCGPKYCDGPHSPQGGSFKTKLTSRVTHQPKEYDLSTLCGTYMLNKPAGKAGVPPAMQLYVGVGRSLTQQCLPHNSTHDETNGQAIIFYPDEPPPKGETCTNPITGAMQTCTSNCAVLGNSQPAWDMPFTQVGMGQFDMEVFMTDIQVLMNNFIVATYTGSQPKKGERDYCAPSVSSPNFYQPRQTNLVFFCDPEIWDGELTEPIVKLININTKAENLRECDYTILFRTPFVCDGEGESSSNMSDGTEFLLVFFVSAFVYIGGGMAWTKFSTGRWNHPHRLLWAAFFMNVQEGINFALAGCKKDSHYAAYTQPPPGAEGGSNTLSEPMAAQPFNTFQAESNPEGYQDL